MKLQLRRFKPSLRIAVAVCVIAAITASLWIRHNQNQYRAAKHHYDALRFGYMAVRAQRPSDADWDLAWRSTWTWPSGMDMNRHSVWAVLPLWDQSLRCAQLRDHYSYISKNPLMMFSPEPEPDLPLAIPLDDSRFAMWWAENIEDHVNENGLNDSWGTSRNTEMMNRQCRFMNVARDLPWFDLRKLMPVEDGYADESEQFQLALHTQL